MARLIKQYMKSIKKLDSRI